MPDSWSNRETWLVSVHFNPETRADLDSIKAYLEEEMEKLHPFLVDYIDLSLIDWDELASTLDPNMDSE